MVEIISGEFQPVGITVRRVVVPAASVAATAAVTAAVPLYAVPLYAASKARNGRGERVC